MATRFCVCSREGNGRGVNGTSGVKVTRGYEMIIDLQRTASEANLLRTVKLEKKRSLLGCYSINKFFFFFLSLIRRKSELVSTFLIKDACSNRDYT